MNQTLAKACLQVITFLGNLAELTRQKLATVKRNFQFFYHFYLELIENE